MKKHLSIFMISLCIICLLKAVIPTKADAGDYVGDFCWNFSSPKASGVVRLGITHIGGGHFLCSGVFTVTKPGSMQFPTYGNAEIVGGQIYITLSSAGIRNGVIGNDMQKAILDPATLNGTVQLVGVYFDAVEIGNGTLTYATCQ